MNLAQILELVAKYAPTIVKIVQTDGPVIEAFLKDLQALQAGQAATAVVPPVSAMSPFVQSVSPVLGNSTTTLAAPKGFPTT